MAVLDPPRPRASGGAWTILGILGGLGILVAMLRAVGFAAIASALSSVRPLPLLIAGLLQIVALSALSRTWRATFAISAGHLDGREAMRITLGAYSLMQLLPAGGLAGGLFAARRLSRRSDPVTAGTTVILVGLVSMGALAALLATGMLALMSVSADLLIYVFASIAAAGMFVGGMLLALRALTDERWRHRVGALLALLRWRGRRPFGNAEALLARHGGLIRDPRVLAAPMAWSGLAWCCALLAYGLIVFASGGAPPVAIVISFAVAHLLNGLPLTPGGLGVVELGMAGTLVAFGTDPAVASVVVIGYRLIAGWLPVAVALPVVGKPLRREVLKPPPADPASSRKAGGTPVDAPLPTVSS